MKYFLRVLIVLVASFALICGFYYGINGTLPIKEPLPETTITKPAATERHNDKIMIASLTSDSIYLYKTNSGFLLTFGDREYEYKNWNNNLNSIEPEIIYDNFDDDKDKEIVIKAAEYKNSEGEYVNCVYYLDPVKDDFEVSYFNRSAWSTMLDETLVEKVNQLKFSKKLAQFSINYRSAGIPIDKETGLATKGYSGYFSTLCDDNKQYYTIDGWKKGTAEYSISSDNKILVDVPVLIQYKETNTTQVAGKIHFQLEKGKKGKIMISPKSLVFITSDEYVVSDPNEYETRQWSYTERNSDIIIDENDKKIDWIKYRTAYDPTITTQTISYASTSTDIRSISELTITESYIKMVAKPDCKFDKSYKNGEYSVIINEGTKSQFDISYTAELTTDEKGFEVLTINFDKPYPKSQIRTININYGAK